MDLALFDLDNTLLDGDSDYEWGRYLCKIGAVDRDHFEATHRQFYQDYCRGQLDINAYLLFSFGVLAQHNMQQLLSWRKSFVQQVIKSMVKTGALPLVDRHRKSGAVVAIISSTNHFIVEPIAQIFGINTVIATEAEIIEGAFTGKLSGIPCFQDGKIIKLKQWILEQQGVYEKSYFYSDSINDLPLLEWVDYPVVVDGDELLLKEASHRDWKSIAL